MISNEKALSAVYSWKMAFFMSVRWQWTCDPCNQFCLLSLLHMQPPIYVHVCEGRGCNDANWTLD